MTSKGTIVSLCDYSGRWSQPWREAGFKVVTKNSVYTVSVEGALFRVRKTADMWGRAVKDKHEHLTSRIVVAVGQPFITSNMRTTNVLAVLPA